jgi:hypothetical protein
MEHSLLVSEYFQVLCSTEDDLELKNFDLL